jgi:hypothetical protein
MPTLVGGAFILGALAYRYWPISKQGRGGDRERGKMSSRMKDKG